MRGNCASTCFFGIMECDRDADRLFYWAAILAGVLVLNFVAVFFRSHASGFPFDVVAKSSDLAASSPSLLTVKYSISSFCSVACPVVVSLAWRAQIRRAVGRAVPLAATRDA